MLHFDNEMCKFPVNVNLLDWTRFDDTRRRKEKTTKKKCFLNHKKGEMARDERNSLIAS